MRTNHKMRGLYEVYEYAMESWLDNFDPKWMAAANEIEKLLLAEFKRKGFGWSDGLAAYRRTEVGI